jgi:thiol:disulfide interchange protein DsbC
MRQISIIFSITALTFVYSVFAGEEAVLDQLKRLRPALQIVDSGSSPIPGIYAIEVEGGSMLYVSEDGLHFILGDMYSVTDDGLINLTDARRAEQRRLLLMSMDIEDMIVFAPRNSTKAVVNVFTDVDCIFCRKFHENIPRINELGIEVRYIAYPRAGIGSTAYEKIVSAWCADDPQEALTRLKLGEAIPSKSCDNPVEQHFELGQMVGVDGTPTLVTEDGEIILGYLSAMELANRLGLL